MNIMRARFFAWLLVLSPALVGCTPEQAARLVSGEPVPGFRIRVTVAQPLDGETVAQRIQSIADNLQFVPFRNPDVHMDATFGRLGVPEDSHISNSFTILEADGEQRFRLRYVFGFANDSSAPTKGGTIEFIDFIFDSRFGEPLSFEQWTYFCRLKSQILPAIFIGDEVSVVRHPTRFTEEDEASRIVRAFGGNNCEAFSG